MNNKINYPSANFYFECEVFLSHKSNETGYSLTYQAPIGGKIFFLENGDLFNLNGRSNPLEYITENFFN
jgi:hypothetical protein